MHLQKGVIFTIIGIVIVYSAIVVFSDMSQVYLQITSMKVELIPIILGIQVGSFFFRSIRQKLFLENIGIKISFKKNFKIFLAGLSMIITPFGSGTAIKSQFLKNEYGIERKKTVPIIFYERYFDFLSIVVVMIILSFYFTSLISQVVLAFASVLLVGLFVMMKNRRLLRFFVNKITKIKLLNRVTKKPDTILDSMDHFNSPKLFGMASALSIFSVILDLVAIHLTFYSLDMLIPFPDSSQLFLTSILVGVFSFLPGGLGVTEGSFLGLLASYGFEMSSASSLVLMSRVFTIWYMTIVGLVTLKFLKF